MKRVRTVLMVAIAFSYIFAVVSVAVLTFGDIKKGVIASVPVVSHGMHWWDFWVLTTSGNPGPVNGEKPFIINRGKRFFAFNDSGIHKPERYYYGVLEARSGGDSGAKVPEPSSLLLIGVGLVGAWFLGRSLFKK